MTKFTLALFQHACGSGRAATDGADILITPELYLSGYNIGSAVEDLVEPTNDLREIARARAELTYLEDVREFL
jgi:predicted amidohydrolase